jgi:hypothetical protein
MSILEHVKLPPSPATTAVERYLLAMAAKDFGAAAKFLSDDVYFNGLVMNLRGRDPIVRELHAFLPAIETLRVEAAAQVELGDPARYLVLYWFKLLPQAAAQPLCDHITVRAGRIIRIDNVFDVRKLPAMP